MALKVGFKLCKTDNCIFYRVNELGTAIVIVYVDDTLSILYKKTLTDMIEYINKEYVTK